MTNGKIDVEVVGTLQQRIESCLNVLDDLLTSPQAIVSSIVIPEKHNNETAQDSQMTISKSVMKIMGIRDIKTVSKNASLAEVGMDSLMAVEIKQMLEREFNVFLSPQQLRSLTFGKLEEISNGNSMENDAAVANEAQLNILFRSLGDESISNQILLPLNNVGKSTPSIIFIPGKSIDFFICSCHFHFTFIFFLHSQVSKVSVEIHGIHLLQT